MQHDTPEYRYELDEIKARLLEVAGTLHVDKPVLNDMVLTHVMEDIAYFLKITRGGEN